MLQQAKHPLLIIVALLAYGCVPIKTTEPIASIGPYPAFTGRLIVIEPNRRWQAVISWRAAMPDHGWLRLTHAASARIVEMEWKGDSMWMRDNQAASPDWRPVSAKELAGHGIVLTPQTLTTILLGAMPQAFKSRQPHIWEGRHAGSMIRLHWSQQSRRLTITDITHGRKAILFIQD